MRLLSGLAAAHPFRTVIGGDASLSRRPMRRVIEPLTRMGATIARRRRAPAADDRRRGSARHYATRRRCRARRSRAPSCSPGCTRTAEPRSSSRRRRGIIRSGRSQAFGVRVDAGRAVGRRRGRPAPARRRSAVIPGDISSAVFWLVLAAGIPGRTLDIDGVGLNPTRACGARRAPRARVRRSRSTIGGQPGRCQRRADRDDPRSRTARRAPFEIAPEEVPGVIDEIPALAALAAMTARADA